MEEKGFSLENFKTYSYTKQALYVMLAALIVAVIGLLFGANWRTMAFGLFLVIVAGTALVLALDFLIAKEFEAIAIEKGYDEKKYFWYSFIFGIIGYLMVIALPKK